MSRAAFLVQNAERVVLGLARVDHDRQPQRPRQLDLLAEHVLLHVARREVVVVVEADLADRPAQGLRVDRRPGLTRRRCGIGGELPGLVRMHADREAHTGPGARHVRRPLELGLVLGAEDDQRAGRVPRSFARADDVAEIARELLAGEMAVGIDHRTRAPAGRLGSTATSDGGPPSVLAASTMPFDSMPIIGPASGSRR